MLRLWTDHFDLFGDYPVISYAPLIVPRCFYQFANARNHNPGRRTKRGTTDVKTSIEALRGLPSRFRHFPKKIHGRVVVASDGAIPNCFEHLSTCIYGSAKGQNSN
jgi:hypothetical protein